MTNARNSIFFTKTGLKTIKKIILRDVIYCSVFVVFNSINDAIEALESKQVNGMLLDRYAASYYQRDGKLESLITVKKLDLQRDIGALFHNNRKALAECLINNFRSDIWRSVQGITDLYKVIFKVKKKDIILASNFWILYAQFTDFSILRVESSKVDNVSGACAIR